MLDAAALLAAHDEQLRTDAETPNAVSVDRLGPLFLVTFPAGRGFVTYRDLGGADADGIRKLVDATVSYYLDRPGITRVEWKTRGHDRAPGLPDALIAHGFVPDDAESIMIGQASGLAVDVPLPAGVTLRTVTEDQDVRAACVMQDEVFGGSIANEVADATLQRLADGSGIELWVAETDGWIVSAGRVDPVPGTQFAGIWGGATRPEYRGRGIYRALTAARAASALRLGKTLVYSESTEFSRPILERSGLVKVSTTTPYRWRRGAVCSS